MFCVLLSRVSPIWEGRVAGVLIHSLAGKIAGLVSLLGFIPYIIATLKGRNRPNRATWIIWTVVGVALLASYRAAGATDAIWVTVANVIAFGAVVIVSIKHGEGGWNFFDVGCLVGAAGGFGLWWYFESPLPTLYISIVIDLIGALPTLKKSYINPAGEDRLTWTLFWAANTLNLVAVSQWNFAMAAYPIYLFLISGTMVLILYVRRAR